MPRIGGLVVSIAMTAMAVPLAAQQTWPGRASLQPEACTPASGPGAELIGRGIRTTGIPSITGALRFSGTETSVQAFQSDRMYPPFISDAAPVEFTFDPGTGAERARAITPGGTPGRDLVRTPKGLLAIRDTVLFPAPAAYRFFEAQRPLNPLAMLVDWRNANAVIVARCVFRDYLRVVLSRGVPGERLYLEARTGMPVKYERVESHFLWGQVRAEYVYATWWQAGSTMLPIVAVRYVDGVEEFRRDLTLPQGPDPLATDVPLAQAFPRPLPSPLPDHSATPEVLLQAVPVDTFRVADQTFLLKTQYYTHAVTMVRDTVYLFDATTAEWRSRADSAWIDKLFPAHRAVVLVVTDLAWPHVSGVRFWAARGAPIVTHRLSRPFLERVIDRPWTLAPDAREQGRKGARRTRWVLVDSAATLAGGAIRLAAIDGPSSEGALMALVSGPGFLWAGDYVQAIDRPSTYAREVIAAAGRAGFSPSMVAAQHLRLTPWATVTTANPAQ